MPNGLFSPIKRSTWTLVSNLFMSISITSLGVLLWFTRVIRQAAYNISNVQKKINTMNDLKGASRLSLGNGIQYFLSKMISLNWRDDRFISPTCNRPGINSKP